jgi:phosphatidylglycerophosphatase A
MNLGFAFFDVIGLSFLALLVLVIIGVGILAFEVWMFLDAWKNKSINEDRRLIWLIGMLLLHPFVALLYYFTDYKNDRKI